MIMKVFLNLKLYLNLFVFIFLIALFLETRIKTLLPFFFCHLILFIISFCVISTVKFLSFDSFLTHHLDSEILPYLNYSMCSQTINHIMTHWSYFPLLLTFLTFLITLNFTWLFKLVNCQSVLTSLQPSFFSFAANYYHFLKIYEFFFYLNLIKLYSTNSL